MEDRAVTLQARLTRKQQRRLAWKMLTHTENLRRGPLDEPATWRALARRCGADIQPFYMSGVTPGEYVPVSDDPRYTGVILYNLAYGRRTRVRALAHELAHHLLQTWVPCAVYDAATVYSFHDDPRDKRHQIARLFERMVVSRIRLGA